MKTLFKKLFSVEYLLPASFPRHTLPSTKEMYRKTINIAWPSAMEAVLISLIGAVDMIMVGTIGTNAIAAVGITNQPKFLLMSFVIALNIGTTVIVARRKGQNDQEGAKLALRNALMLSIGLAFTGMMIGLVYARPMLSLAGANIDYIDDAVLYFRIIVFGNFFYLIGLTMTAAQRGVGNTRISLVTNLSANVVNVIFNFLLINGIWIFPRLGILGAALATVIGNVVSLILATNSLFRKEAFLTLHISDRWKLDPASLQTIWRFGSSALVEQFFIRIGFLLYVRAVAGLGTLAFATHYIVMNVMSITFSVGDGLSIATSSLVGQSLGAKRADLAYLHGKVSKRIGLIISVGLGIVIMLTRVEIMRLFTKDQSIIELGSIILIILAFIIQFQIPQVITIGSLRGAGDVRFVAKLQLFSVTLFRPLLTYLMAYFLGWGLYGAWFSVMVDQLIRYFASRSRFKTAEWAKIDV